MSSRDMRDISLLIENVHILTIDENFSEYESGFIAVDNGQIVDIGKMGDREVIYRAERVIDGKGKVAMPGFVNTHAHSAMVLFRGYANDLPLWEWLSEKIWPLEDRLVAEDIYWLSLLAMAEMISSGTTVFSDMYMFMEETARAVEKVGMRAVLARGLQGPDDNSDMRLMENRQLWERWHGGAEGRIKVMVGPHAIYTCSTDYLRECIRLAYELDTGIHIHISETEREVMDCLKEYGKTPIAYLEELGLFNQPTLAAHCVHVQDSDMDILAERGVSIAHCPYSNLKLASGFMPAAHLVKRGINISLGTDGASSNNNLSLIKEMQLAAVLGKAVAKDAAVLTASEVLRMATINGAKALHWEEAIGSLELGKRADMVLIDMDKPHYRPQNDASSLLVYSGHSSDVDTVIVDGNVLMEEGQLKTIDLEEVYSEVDRIKGRIMGGNVL